MCLSIQIKENGLAKSYSCLIAILTSAFVLRMEGLGDGPMQESLQLLEVMVSHSHVCSEYCIDEFRSITKLSIV